MAWKLAMCTLGVLVASVACGDDGDSGGSTEDAGVTADDDDAPVDDDDDAPVDDDDDVPVDDDDVPVDDDDVPVDDDDDVPADDDDVSADAGNGGDAGAGDDTDAGAPVSDGDAGAAQTDDDAGAATDDGDAGADAEPEALQSILYGTFSLMPDGTQGEGVAQLLRTEDGRTVAQIQVTGLAADTTYPSHVHSLPCGVNAGNGHYLIDPEAAAEEANEIWPGFTTDADGTGHGRAEVDHIARGDAQSVMVHDPDTGDKILCADLLTSEDADDVTFQGSFAAFADAEATDDSIAGDATLTRGPGGTNVTLSVSGLDAAATYTSHVHAFPCDVMNAGGHYMIDPAGAAEEANELWPQTMVDVDGNLETSTDFLHTARADAQSVVIHRDGPKVACADLLRDAWPELVTSGNAVVLAAATDQGVDGLAADAMMTRSLDGLTTVELSASGLAASTDYPAHVHNRPCSIGDGGAHYKLDESVEDTVEGNEIWVSLSTDDAGEASTEVWVAHTARPEAQAIVIHGDGGARLACIDLD